ncbi:MAG: hypothetical protein H7267_04265 [Sandarakinorhabdus sp.]|nr:hypothetical protein [Sandarakinorhabdus sp.]
MIAENGIPIIHLMPQLAFRGQCRQAIKHYVKVLGGNITVINSFGDIDATLPLGSIAAAPDRCAGAGDPCSPAQSRRWIDPSSR